LNLAKFHREEEINLNYKKGSSFPGEKTSFLFLLRKGERIQDKSS